MKFTAQVVIFELDERGLINNIRKSVEDATYDAANQFLEAAAPNVPIRTGMARGSFLNLRQILKSKSIDSFVDIPTRPQMVTKSGRAYTYIHSDGGKFPKTPFTARKFSTKTKKIISWENDRVLFNYQIDVVHFNVNDVKLGWMSIQRGKEAFLRHRNFKSLNNILHYVEFIDAK